MPTPPNRHRDEQGRCGMALRGEVAISRQCIQDTHLHSTYPRTLLAYQGITTLSLVIMGRETNNLAHPGPPSACKKR